MKTQIIQLAPNDDHISVRDRMNWIQTGRIILLWPEHGHILNGQLELDLVERHASKLGAQLALVTNDSKVRRNAYQLGVQVFDNLDQAQTSQWKVSEEKSHGIRSRKIHPHWENQLRHGPKSSAESQHPVKRIFLLGISLLSLLALSIFILPGAKIMVAPQVETQSITLDLTADPLIDAIDPTTNSLPVYNQDVIVEGSDSTLTTGSVTIPSQTATGRIQITNISDHDVILPAELVVTTQDSDPVGFSISQPNDQVLAPKDSVILDASALQSGTTGNLSADTLVKIKDPLGLDLVITTPEATSGGMDAAVPSPNLDDLTRLRQTLSDKLEEACLAKLQIVLSDGDILIPESLKLIEVISETSTLTFGEPGSMLNLSMRVRYQIQVVSADLLQELINHVLDTKLPASYSPIGETLQISQLSTPALDKAGKATWTVGAHRNLQANVELNSAINRVKGISITHAVELLSDTLPLAEPPQISLSPSWWPRLPLLPMRIQVGRK